MSVKVKELSIENFKRINNVELVLQESGTLVVGGDNAQGKSSIQDAIKALLGGDGMIIDKPVKDGADKAVVTAKFSNGLTVRRSFTATGGTNLIVKDEATGMKGNQSTLAKFVSLFALDIDQFLALNDRERTNFLVKATGVDTAPIEAKIKELETQRTLVGRELKPLEGQLNGLRKEGEQRKLSEAGVTAETELRDPVAIMNRLQGLMKDMAGTNNRRFEVAGQCQKDVNTLGYCMDRAKQIEREIVDLNAQIALLNEEHAEVGRQVEDCQKAAEAKLLELDEIDAAVNGLNAQIEVAKTEISEVESFNANVRCAKQIVELDSKVGAKEAEYSALSEAITAERANLSKSFAELPHKELSVQDGVLLYKGQPWGNMSHSEQLIVATSIVRKLKPECGFVFIDKAEAMDVETLKTFDAWLVENDLQAIMLRVSKGEECNVIIEDGKVK